MKKLTALAIMLTMLLLFTSCFATTGNPEKDFDPASITVTQSSLTEEQDIEESDVPKTTAGQYGNGEGANEMTSDNETTTGASIPIEEESEGVTSEVSTTGSGLDNYKPQ